MASFSSSSKPETRKSAKLAKNASPAKMSSRRCSVASQGRRRSSAAGFASSVLADMTSQGEDVNWDMDEFGDWGELTLDELLDLTNPFATLQQI